MRTRRDRGRGVVAFEAESSKSFNKEGSVDVINFIFLSFISKFIAGLPDIDNSIFAFVLDIDKFVLDDVSSVEVDLVFDHVEFFLSMEEVVERELGNVGTVHD